MGFKSIVDRHSSRPLGAHLSDHHAEEMISFFALAVRKEALAVEPKKIS